MRCHICDSEHSDLYYNPKTRTFEPCDNCLQAINDVTPIDLDVPTVGAPLDQDLVILENNNNNEMDLTFDETTQQLNSSL